MKLSIILTVYNKEPFLRRALDALLNQKDTNDDEYEVLAVNDGSTDGSAVILDEYAQRDNRLRILTQQNQGLSMARNNGVEPAQGDYVWFVDADDTFSPFSVRLICDAMISHPDVIPIYAKTDGIDKIRNRVNPNLHTGKEILANGGWEHCGVFWVLRKEFLLENNLRFFPGIYHEDAEFTPRMLYMAKSAHVVPEVLYTVYRDPNSITQVPRPKRAFDCLTVAERLSMFFEKNNDDSMIDRMLNYRISMLINDALSVISKNSREDRHKFDKTFRTKPMLINILKKASVRKYRIEAVLFRCFPGHYTAIYRMMKRFGGK
jgi:glycosyltransferase involved in cell wall biosynthesis